ncbi:signal peptidase I SipW [Bacillus kwashiorkori]|uniref:signal peptidase I SipW n=1 Tax=Bacillus kwashiorkori TaxID=1522318 RepID=UPI000782BF95|nr:signal peptidase I [Bacillus kwashiorkori]
MKKNKVWVWVNRIVTTLLFVLLLSVATLVIASRISGGEPSLFGYQLKTVLSGSMEPSIKTGSIIAVKPGGDMTRFQENDVITYRTEDGKLITHRIIEVITNESGTMYRTKGDNNETADNELVLSPNIVAEYTGFTIPFVGYFSEFAKSKNGNLFLLIIPGILIFVGAMISMWRTVTKLEKQQKNSQTPPIDEAS